MLMTTSRFTALRCTQATRESFAEDNQQNEKLQHQSFRTAPDVLVGGRTREEKRVRADTVQEEIDLQHASWLAETHGTGRSSIWTIDVRSRGVHVTAINTRAAV